MDGIFLIIENLNFPSLVENSFSISITARNLFSFGVFITISWLSIFKSIKDVRKNFKAGNYLAISTLLLLIGLAIVLSQIYTGQYFIQSLIYFSMALLCILIFALISWRILK